VGGDDKRMSWFGEDTDYHWYRCFEESGADDEVDRDLDDDVDWLRLDGKRDDPCDWEKLHSNPLAFLQLEDIVRED